jgi:multidrug efflux system membrane fusion protein
MDQIVERPQQDFKAETPRGRRRRGFPGLTFLVLVLLIGAAVYYWTHRQPAEAPAQRGRGEQAQSVGVATVTKADVPVTYDGLGTVTALATVTVKTQIAGQLTELGFKEGQIVKKGDFLAQIDPRPYQVALEQAQGALARDEALLKDAQLDLARYQRLSQQDSIARQQVDTQSALVQQDQGTIQTDKAAIDTAKLNLVYCHIVSPVEGRVGLRQVDAGNYVQTSDTNGIVVITQLQPISVIFTQPEDRIPAIMRRINAGAKLSASVYDRSGTRLIADGEVETLDNQIDTTTGTAKLRAIFGNADTALFPNQFVNVKLLLETLKDATVVPSAAIQVGTPGSYVYKVNADDTVIMTPIKAGQVDGEVTAVLNGLAPGDRVVIDGIDRLRDGVKVRIPGDRRDGKSGPGVDGAKAGAGGAKADATGSGGAGAADATSEPKPAEEATGDHKRMHRRRQDQAADQPGAADQPKPAGPPQAAGPAQPAARP